MRALFTSALGLALALTGTLPAPPKATADKTVLVVVAHPSSGESSLSPAELDAVFRASMRKWRNGTNIVPFNYAPSSALRKAFDKAVLGLSPDEVSRFWIDQRIRGGTRPPRQVSSPHLMARVVAQLPGAIGYVPAEDVPSTGVRVLARVRGDKVIPAE